MFKTFTTKGLIVAGGLFLSATAPVHAAEVTTHSTVQKDTDSISESVDSLFDELDSRLAMARAQRIAGDNLLLQDLNVAVTAMTARLDTVEGIINTLDARFNEIRTLLRADIDATRASVNQLRTDLNANTDYVQWRINQTYGYINSTISGLQSQINAQNSSIADLYARSNQIYSTIGSLEAFAHNINAQMEALAACVANATCLPTRNMNFERYNITIYTGEAIAAGVGVNQVCNSWFLWWCTGYGPQYYTIYAYGTKPLGLYYPTWSYCAITGAENQDVRDYRIYLSGSQWTLRNETIADSGAGNQQEGTVYASCLRVY